MINKQKDEIKKIVQGALDNTLSIAVNNLIMEAAIAFNSAELIPESQRNKQKELEFFIRAINGQLKQAKEQVIIYVDHLIEE